MPVATLAEVKTYLELTASTHDVRLQDALNRAQAIAESYCNRKFDEGTFTEYFDGGGRNMLLLRNYPVASVASVHDDFSRTYGDATLIAPTSYGLDKELGILRLDSGLFFLDGNQNVKVVYTGGYADAPHDLKQAVILGAVALFEERKNVGVNSRSLGEGGTVSYRHGIPDEIMMMLAPFRSRRIA